MILCEKYNWKQVKKKTCYSVFFEKEIFFPTIKFKLKFIESSFSRFSWMQIFRFRQCNYSVLDLNSRNDSCNNNLTTPLVIYDSSLSICIIFTRSYRQSKKKKKHLEAIKIIFFKLWSSQGIKLESALELLEKVGKWNECRIKKKLKLP